MKRAALYMVVSSLGFSLMQVCVKLIDDLPTFEIIWLRSMVALAITSALLRQARVSPWGNNRGLLLLRGIFGLIGLSLFFFTLRGIPLASAITIQYASPIFTSIAAIFWLKERLRLIQWLFFLVSFVGVGMVKGFDDNVSLFYLFLGLTSALFSGLAYNSIRLLRRSEHPYVVVLYFHLVALPLIAPFALADFVWPSLTEWLLLLGMGAFAQVGQVFMTRALQVESAGSIISVKYVGILFAVGFGFVIFQEEPPVLALLGSALVLGGVIGNLYFRPRVSEQTATKA